MDDSKLLERIAINPKVMVGKPVIRGTRLTVQHILGLLASGMIIDETLQQYTGLTREDVLASFLPACQRVSRNYDFCSVEQRGRLIRFLVDECIGPSVAYWLV